MTITVVILLSAFASCDININLSGGNETAGISGDLSDGELTSEALTPESTADLSLPSSSEFTTGNPVVTTLPEITTQPEVTTQPQTPTQPVTTVAERPADADMAAEAEKFINSEGVNGILFTEFTDVKDANLWQVVAQLNDPAEPSDLEALYAKNGKLYSEYTGARAVRVSYLDSYLKTWTGYVSRAFKDYGEFGPIYLATADMYSVQFGGVEFNPAKVIKTETDPRNGYIYVYYTADGRMSDHWLIKYNSELSSVNLMLLCLDWIDGHFVILSNQAVWSTWSEKTSRIFNERLTQGLSAPGLNGLLRDNFQEDYFFNGNYSRVFSANIYDFVCTYLRSNYEVDYDYPTLYAEYGITYNPDTGVVGVPGDVIRKDILRYTGYDIDTFMNNPQIQFKPHYLAKVDVYSVQFGDVRGVYLSDVSVEWVDNVYHVTFVDRFTNERGESYLRLNWDGSYQILANRIIKGMG